MKWFRFYSDAMHNPKVLRLGHEQYRFWTYLLCLASEAEPRGTLPSAHDIATIIRWREPKVKRLITELLSSGLLEETCSKLVKPHNWQKRQPDFDHPAPRMREYRKRKKSNEKRNENGDADESIVTEPLRNSYVLDSDSDSDSEPELILSLCQPASEFACTDAGAGDAGGRAGRRAGTRERNINGIKTCIELARNLFGPEAAEAVASGQAGVEGRAAGRWDCYAAALRQIRREQDRPGARPVEDLHALAVAIAKKYAADGIPPEPVAVAASLPPPKSREEQIEELNRRIAERAAR